MESNNIIDKRTKGTYEVVYDTDIQIKETGMSICTGCYSGHKEDEILANMTFICKAVNNYDSLLAALKMIAQSTAIVGIRIIALEAIKTAEHS